MLFKSGVTVALFTTFSRVLGLVRELFFAAIFGLTPTADCVNVALRFPNLFRRILGEGALTIVFVPILNKKLLESKESALKFSGKVLTMLVIVLVMLSVIVEILMPYLIIIIVPGFCKWPHKYELTVLLCRITTPYLIFVSVNAILGSMLNSVKNFAAFAFVPIIMNVCIILFTYFFGSKLTAAFAISYSLIFSGILQLAFMWFYILRAKLVFSPSFCFHNDPDVSKLIKNIGPTAITSATQQINFFLSQSIASFIPGAISVLSYAERLYQFPISIIGGTFATILLPELSQIYQKKDIVQANNLQNNAILLGLIFSMPAAIWLFSLSNPIVFLLYERGVFCIKDTSKTANALAAFSLGIPAFITSKILMPVFYANGETKGPMRVTIYSSIINIFFNILLIIPFSYVGIALGSSIASWFNVFLLKKYITNYTRLEIFKKTKFCIYKIATSAFTMLIVLRLFSKLYNNLYYSSCLSTKVLVLFFTILVTSIVYILMLYFFKIHVIFKKN